MTHALRSPAVMALLSGDFCMPAYACGRQRQGVGRRVLRKPVQPVPSHDPYMDVPTEGFSVFGLATHFGMPMRDALRKASEEGWTESMRKDMRRFHPPVAVVK